MYVLLNYNDNKKEFTISDTKDSSVETLGIDTIEALANKDISLSLFTFYSGLESYKIKEMLLNPLILYNFVAVTPTDTENYISLDGRKTFHIDKSLRGSSTKGLPENLLKEWNYEKNGDLNPLKLTSGSGRKVWWKCFRHHEWQAVIDNRVRHREGCPFCSGQKVLQGYNDLATTNPEIAKEWNYEKNLGLIDGKGRDISTPDKVTANSNKKVWWLCPKMHSYNSIIAHRVQGRNCPFCSGQKVLQGYNDLATVKPDLIMEWNYEKNNIKPQDVTVGSRKKVWWKCKTCGNSWQAAISNRALLGSSCPICALSVIAKKRSTPKQGNDLATKRPDLLSEWDYEKNNNISPNIISYGSHKKVWWKCKTCGNSWQASLYAKTRNESECPYCSNRRILVGFNDLATTRPDLASEWNYEKNDITPQEVTCGSGKKVWWRCQNNHEWQAMVLDRNHGRNCPYCSGSKTERLTYDILKDLGINYTAEKKFKEYMPVSFYPFDVWIPSENLIIELDGKQHFEYIEGYFENNVPYTERRRRDNLKNNFCLENHIPILRIPYDINPDDDADVIKFIIEDFVNNHIVHNLIIEYYSAYSEDNNYSEVATKLNEWVKQHQKII